MVRKTSIAALVVGLIVATSFVGAAAFTTATVERDVTVGIEADNNAIIGLQPGTADAAELNGNDQLVIEPETNVSNGLNQNATFVYGDNSTPQTSQAFNITNNDDESHEFTLTYSGSGQGSLTFYVENDSTSITLNNGDTKSITLSNGEIAHVVITVNSGAGTGQITGTLTIEAT